MAKIKLDLTHLKIAVLIVYLKQIAGKMTGNTQFTSQSTKSTALREFSHSLALEPTQMTHVPLSRCHGATSSFRCGFLVAGVTGGVAELVRRLAHIL